MGLRTYILRRLVDSMVTYVIIFFMVFFAFFYLPLSKDYPQISPLQIFLTYLQFIFVEKFGKSRWGIPTIEAVKIGVFRTIIILLPAIVISIIIGYIMGARGAWKCESVEDDVYTGFWLFMYGLPVFWIGMLLLLIFSIGLGWFPTYGLHEIPLKYTPSENPVAYVLDITKHIFLPVLSLTLTTTGIFYIIMRNSMIGILNEDFIRTAKAKGLNEKDIIHKHAARAAILPSLSMFGLSLVLFSTNIILTEVLFSIQGLGFLLYRSATGFIFGPDLGLLLASFLLFSLVVIATIHVLDVAYAFLDPRIRVEGGS